MEIVESAMEVRKKESEILLEGNFSEHENSFLKSSHHFASANDDLFTHFFTFTVAFKWIFSIIMMLQELQGRLLLFSSFFNRIRNLHSP